MSSEYKYVPYSSFLTIAMSVFFLNAGGVSAQEKNVPFSTDQIIFLPNDTMLPLKQKEVAVELTAEDLSKIESASGEGMKSTQSEEQAEIKTLPQINPVTDVFEDRENNEISVKEDNVRALPVQSSSQMQPIVEGGAQASSFDTAMPEKANNAVSSEKAAHEASLKALAVMPTLQDKADVSTSSQALSSAELPEANTSGYKSSDTDLARNEMFWRSMGLTFENSPVLQRERENVRFAYEKVFEARTGWLPNISAEAGITSSYYNYDSAGNTDETVKSASMGVQQPIYRSGRVLHALKKEEFNAQSAYFDYINSVQNTLLSYVTAYIDVVTAKSSLEYNKANVDRITRQNAATQKEYEVGLLTLTDVSQSKARLSLAQSDYIQAQGYLQQKLAIFTEVTGLNLSEKDFVFPTIEFSALLGDSFPKTLREAQFAALENNPNRKSSLLQIKAAQANVELNKSELYPEISLSGSVARQDTGALSSDNGVSSATIGLVASIPIYDSGLTKSRIRQSKIEKFSQYDNDTSVKREIVQTVTTAYQDYLTAKAVIESSKAGLEAAKTAREGVYSEREVGTRTVLDALDADQELLNAQVQLITAKRNLLLGKFQLLSAMGDLTPDVLPLKPHFDDKLNQEFSALSFKQLFSSDVEPMDNY